MATPEETLAATGFKPGGVCPFGVEGIEILLDESLAAYGAIYPAAGTDSSGVPVDFETLKRITGGRLVDCTDTASDSKGRPSGEH
jgi:prolyl-tRNA editing enzyme YbaK/EbsC (Cys-tRNA(Pro) deacylase)